MATCSLDTYLDGLASQLKDCTPTSNGVKKHVRWTKEHLTWILCIAANQIKQDRGDLFLEDKRIKLSAGCYTLACSQGCEDIRGPIYLEGDECSKIAVKEESDTWGDDFFDSLPCLGAQMGDNYRVESIEIDPEDPCKIKVNPPVPDDGQERYIIARCTQDLSQSIEDGVLPRSICDNLHAFTQLVLSYAYGMDGMVNVNNSQSKQYHDNYRELINDSAFNDLSLRDRRIIFGQRAANLGS